MAEDSKTISVYDEAAIEARLSDELPDWSYTEGNLTRTFKTRNWIRTQLLFNAIAYLAEKINHHPDMTVSYNTLAVRIMTHSVGGITDKDFVLAAKIDELVH